MIVNSKAKTTRPITLEVSVQEQKSKDNINSELAQEENSDISNRDVCPLCNRPVKTRVECGICGRWFHYRCEGNREERVLEEYPHKTHYICKKDKEQKQLEISENSNKKKKKEQK